MKNDAPQKANTEGLSTVAVHVVFFVFASICIGSYHFQENLAPEAFILVIQSVILYMAIAILCFIWPVITVYLSFFIILVGLIEAIWGLGQLYNALPSKHLLFKTTGSFFNPGPYGGFIAVVFPLLLQYWLQYGQKSKYLSYVFLFVGSILLLVFPATLSRAAWVSALVGCSVVVALDTRIITLLRTFRKNHKKQFAVYTTSICMVLVASLWGVYQIKKDSANGRLFTCKITALAIKDAPGGVGLGGFAAEYAKTQIQYFKKGKASEVEKSVAGTPEYAFNEYLRICLEQGILGITTFTLLSVLIIKEGVKNKQAGAVGSFVTLSVFAFASYPYYLWAFIITWISLAIICTSKAKISYKSRVIKPYSKMVYVATFIALGVLCVASSICAVYQYKYDIAAKAWKKSRPLAFLKAYGSVIDVYANLYPTLSHNPNFVFEFAQALNATRQREKADSVLSRGLRISCDPMFYNMKGRNYHEMGKYNKAEECYLNSTHLLPKRIYPYYLMTKLYADPRNYQPEKMQKAAMYVLKKEPKIYSKAIDEMRTEVAKILKNINGKK